MPYVDPVQLGHRMTDSGCYGSVLLDKELWNTLSEMNGGDVPWVHGCALDHGHDGDHGAPAYGMDGVAEHWLRWRNTSPARLERVELSPPGRHSRSLGEPPPNRRPAPSPTGIAAARSPGEVGLPATGSQTEALWAIAAALERLADAVARLGILTREKEVD